MKAVSPDDFIGSVLKKENRNRPVNEKLRFSVSRRYVDFGG